MRSAPKIVLMGMLAAAFLSEGAVLYFMEDPLYRLYAGLALFIVIGWILATPQVSEVIRALPERVRPRRYPRMRTQVELFLAEVRRLNWLAVDGHRGFRDPSEAVAEMDVIEERMKEIVGRIREEAGVESDEPPPDSTPDQTAPEADELASVSAPGEAESLPVAEETDPEWTPDEADPGPGSDEELNREE